MSLKSEKKNYIYNIHLYHYNNRLKNNIRFDKLLLKE